MAITLQNPRTVYLGPTNPPVLIGDLVASVAITPGYLVERVNSSGLKVRPHNSAGGFTNKLVAVDQSEMNKGLDDAYAIGDLVEFIVAQPGDKFYMLLASGQNVTQAVFLESNGDGTLRGYGAGTRLFQALESVNNSASVTAARIRVEAI